MATFLPREEWAKPRGRKSQRRCCGSDDRGEAGLRPDQAINEATCVRVLNHNLWRSVASSVLMNKRSERFSAERETICCKGRHRLPRTDQVTSLCRGCEGQTECRQLDREFRGGTASPALKFRSPLFNAPIYAHLFDDEGGKRTSFGPCDLKNWSGRVLHRPTRLERASLRQSH